MQFSTTFIVAAIAGLAASAPAVSEHVAVKRFAPGRCGVHVRQYQKNEFNNPTYVFDIRLADADQTEIGSVSRQAIADTSTFALASQLPFDFVVGSGSLDSDPVTFSYNGQNWNSNDATNHQCGVGAYDSGSRAMDCSFDC